MASKNLKYQAVTLLVPYREGEHSPPEDWDWWTLTDCGEPVWLTDAEDLTADDARETLIVNGFGNDLAKQVADDA